MTKRVKKCPKCSGELQVKSFDYTCTVKGQVINTSIKKNICGRCGYKFSDSDMEDENIYNIYAVYKKRNNLLLSHDIVRIRKDLGWSQERLANYLGVDVEVIDGYEHGGIQLKLHDQYIRDLEARKHLRRKYVVKFE